MAPRVVLDRPSIVRKWYSGADSGADDVLLPGRPSARARARSREVARRCAARATSPASTSWVTFVRAHEAPRSPPLPQLGPTSCAPAHGRRPFVTWVSKPQHQLQRTVCTFQVQVSAGFLEGSACRSTCAATPYLLTLDDIGARRVCARAWEHGAQTEVCLQGGIHPDFDGELLHRRHPRPWKAAAARHPRARASPALGGHRRRPSPRRAAGPTNLRRLMDAGLRHAWPRHPRPRSSTTRIRAVLCPDKDSTRSRWARRPPATAHSVGLRSNIHDQCFGSIEEPVHWARQHRATARDLQARGSRVASPSSSACPSCTWPRAILPASTSRAGRGPTWARGDPHARCRAPGIAYHGP